MKPIKTELKKIRGEYFINVPEAIVEMMDWSEGEKLFVPFHEITNKGNESWEKEIQKEFKDEIEIDLRNHQKRVVKREDIINLLNNPNPELKKYRTAYIEWNKEKFGSKAIMKEILGHGEFNTIEAEWYLRQLGFLANRTYYIK